MPIGATGPSDQRSQRKGELFVSFEGIQMVREDVLGEGVAEVLVLGCREGEVVKVPLIEEK